MRSRVNLETNDGEYVHTSEIEHDNGAPFIIVWNGRHFVRDVYFSDLKGKRYVETLPIEIPYEMPKARPAEDNGGD